MTAGTQYSRLLEKYGGQTGHWPVRWRVLLPLLKLHPGFRASWQAACIEEQRLNALYEKAAPLEPSAELMARLQRVSQIPQANSNCRVGNPQDDDDEWQRLWPVGFGTALASLCVGIVMGVSGWSAPLLEDDTQSFELSSSYELSQWLQGDDL